MNVWIKVCAKQAICDWCKQPIENRHYEVIGEHLYGKWRIRRRWHPDCWIAQGISSLERNPKVDNRGRNKMSISDTDRSERNKLLMRRAATLRQLTISIESGNAIRIEFLGEKLNDLRNKIENLGGIPSSWK